MATIILESKNIMNQETASDLYTVYCLGMQLFTNADDRIPIPAKFLQTDECVQAFVGVYPFGGVVFSTNVTKITDSIKITAQPLDGSAATTVTITVRDLLAIGIGEAVTA